ncbi:Conserved_hypothetical protein [Hexamita inflata]|uniref:Uncharacterized protein n=1 Tax=Hexamita inflata TaxID=28002 RepID=A0ABP1H6E4_9EUKA
METFVINPYQLSDFKIQYTSTQLQVVDENNRIVERFDINFINENPLNNRFDQNQNTGSGNAHFNRVIYTDCKFYILIKDCLFQIDLNNFTYIDRIPDNKSSGFAKICLFKNQIIVTNGNQLFKLVNNKFEEMQFFYNNRKIAPQNTVLYDFNGHSTVCVKFNQGFVLFEMSEPNCKLIFSSSYLEPVLATSGFQMFKIDTKGPIIVLDFTQESIQVSYYFGECEKIVRNYNNIYVTEYSINTMQMIIPDYDNFNLRRNKIFEEMQAQMPPKATLDQVKTQMYPYITPDKYILQNSYQLENRLIFYKDKWAYVTDMNKKVLEKVPINFITSRKRFANLSLDKNTINSYDQLWYCNNSVYALIDDVLFSVDIFKFKELQKIPGNYGSGYVRVCVYNDQILTSNEKQFFLYEPKIKKFVEKQFFIDGKKVQPYQVALYSYNKNAIARVVVNEDNNDSYFIISLKESNCQVLHIGRRISNNIPALGLNVFNLGNGSSCVVDLTTSPVDVKYYQFEESRSLKNNFVFANNGIDYSKEMMDKFVDENFYFRRNQIYQQEMQQLHLKQLHVPNKFGRIEQPTKPVQFIDIFNMRNTEVERFQQFTKIEFTFLKMHVSSIQRQLLQMSYSR